MVSFVAPPASYHYKNYTNEKDVVFKGNTSYKVDVTGFMCVDVKENYMHKKIKVKMLSGDCAWKPDGLSDSDIAWLQSGVHDPAKQQRPKTKPRLPRARPDIEKKISAGICADVKKIVAQRFGNAKISSRSGLQILHCNETMRKQSRVMPTQVNTPTMRKPMPTATSWAMPTLLETKRIIKRMPPIRAPSTAAPEHKLFSKNKKRNQWPALIVRDKKMIRVVSLVTMCNHGLCADVGQMPLASYNVGYDYCFGCVQ